MSEPKHVKKTMETGNSCPHCGFIDWMTLIYTQTSIDNKKIFNKF